MNFRLLILLLGAGLLSAGSRTPLPPHSGVSQVGYNIYPDMESYRNARTHRRPTADDPVAVTYTVHHPRNPRPPGKVHTLEYNNESMAKGPFVRLG
jgi:hypothetical protein